MAHTYVLITEQTAVANTGLRRGPDVFSYGVTNNGDYVTSANNLNIFPEVFTGAQIHTASLEPSDFPASIPPILSPALALVSAKAAKKAALDAHMQIICNQGMPYTFQPNGPSMVVYTRNDTDKIHLNGQVTGAIAFKGINPSQTIGFRTMDGVHTLTLDQMIIVGLTGLAYWQALYDVKEAHIQAIDALTTGLSVQAYVVTTGWPS